jgi:plasmid stabilization system protein ParE
MHNIIYSNQARIDLDEAISHIAKESVTNAFDYLAGYENKIELVRLNPYMGVECKNKLINRNCRVVVYKSHLIIYRIDEQIKSIFIIRIYHGASDYANSFNKEDSGEQK